MRRREIIALLGGPAVVWSLATSAQTQPKIRRVGCVFSGTPTTGKHVFEAFRQALRELSYWKGKQSYWKSVSACPGYWLSLSVSKWMSWW